jgi:NADPH:quinone reductase-like Zn-dependent oxidoreductase
LFAVQLAASLGSHVTATGHDRDADFVRSLGAERFWPAEDPASQVANEFDVVIDTVGGQALDRSFDLLRDGGRLVTLSAPPDQAKAARRHIQATFFIVSANATALAGLAERVCDQRLRPVISQEFPLAQGREAYESGRNHPRPPGKTILVVQ